MKGKERHWAVGDVQEYIISAVQHRGQKNN